MNRLVWRALYGLAETRYKLEKLTRAAAKAPVLQETA